MRPILGKRVRRIAPPFGWISFEVLSRGLLEGLSPASQLLYFFLCLVADRQGMSFYGDRRLMELLGMHAEELHGARCQLAARDLVAFDGRRYQVLSLPGQGHQSAPAIRRAPRPQRGDSPKRLGEVLGALLEKGQR